MKRNFRILESVISQIIKPFKTIILEIGSDRGQGSSGYLYNLSLQSNTMLISVDQDAVYLPKEITRYVMNGETFTANILPTLNKDVSVVYFDGFDWIYDPYKVRNGSANTDTYNIIDEYSRKGSDLNNVNSAISHLKQVINLLPHLSDKCIIMFEDTWFNQQIDTFEGKGAGAIYLLLANNFTILSASYDSNYVLMGRNINCNLINIDFEMLNKKYNGNTPFNNRTIYIND